MSKVAVSKRWFILLIAFMTILMSAGCALIPTRPAVSVEIPSPTAQALWQVLKTAERKSETLKGIARIDLTTSSGRYPLKVAIVSQYPNRFRLESLPLFGPPDFYLTVDNGELKVFLPQEGRYYMGKSSQKQLAYFLPFISSSIQLSDVLALLRGHIPLIQDQGVTVKGFKEQEYRRLEVYRGDKKVQVFWLMPESHQLVRAAQWGNDGELLYTVQFEGYGDLKEAADFPARIAVATGSPNPLTLTLHYTVLQVLQEVQQGLFSLEVPPGMKPLRLNQETNK